jgi:hypothetical protein
LALDRCRRRRRRDAAVRTRQGEQPDGRYGPGIKAYRKAMSEDDKPADTHDKPAKTID